MSAFTPLSLPNVSAQKQNLLAQLMQQHQQASLRFAGQAPGMGLNLPGRGVAPPSPFYPGPPQAPVKPLTSFPSSLYGPTIARIRSVGV